MESLPSEINQDIFVYSLPLFLICVDRPQSGYIDYWKAIPGCITGHVPLGSKVKLIISTFLYLIQVVRPSLHFFCFGFAVYQAYNANLLISKKSTICKAIGKIEIIGFIISEVIRIPQFVRLLGGVLVLLITTMASPPNTECKDPFERMKVKISSPRLLNIEYRLYMKNKSNKSEPNKSEPNKSDRSRNNSKDESKSDKPKEPLTKFKYNGIFFTDVLLMLSNRRILLLYCSFFSFGRWEIIILGIAIMMIYGWTWEYLCLILKADATPHTLLRVCMTYAIYLLVYLAKEMI